MAEIKCPKCDTVYRNNPVVCGKCGTLLFDPKSSTVYMRVDPSLLRLRRKREVAEGETVAERTVILQIRGLTEKLVFEEDTEIVLGRLDFANPDPSRLDLTPYGGHERGVSREHARLRFNENQLTITDLGSVNGTKLNLKKLETNQPTVLHNGDEIMLGSLSIVVRTESNSATGTLSPEKGKEEGK
jgi:hypothetical protein